MSTAYSFFTNLFSFWSPDHDECKIAIDQWEDVDKYTVPKLQIDKSLKKNGACAECIQKYKLNIRPVTYQNQT